MSALTFTLRAAPQQRIDCSPLTPDRLAGMSAPEITDIELQCGKHRFQAGELFEIKGESGSHIVIEHSEGKLDNIGHGMQDGRITVNGNAGDYAGFAMAGGGLVVEGSVEAFAAGGMRGGLLHVKGNAGDFLGSAIAGERQGMKGGTVIVTGNAGERAGDQMRRGLLLIEGNVGNYCGSRMIAGTIGVLGDVGQYAGYAMRRGTLLLQKTPQLHATIMDCGLHTLPYLKLMYKSFAGLPTSFVQLQQNRVRRYAGDIANDGKGEILILQ